jgi:ERF superfamily
MAKNTTTEALNIHLALALIIAEIEAVPKAREMKGGEGGPQYKFRGVEDVVNALHPIFASKGVVLVPGAQTTAFERFEVTGKYGTKTTYSASVVCKYELCAADGSSKTGEGAGFALDQGDKALPKAQSMALKNFLTTMFLIPTRDIGNADDHFTFDAAAAAGPGAEYEGKTQAELEALRDKLMAGGEMPPKELLGRISVMKAEEADAAAALDKPKKEAAPKTEKPAAKKEPAKAAPPPPKEEPAPGAEPDEFAPAEDDIPMKHTALDHVLSIEHSKYKDKSLGSFDKAQLIDLRNKWANNPKYDAAIKAKPAAVKDREMLLAAIAEWEEMEKKAATAKK